MTNLRTDEMVYYRNLTKIDTDENKAIYSIILQQCVHVNQMLFRFNQGNMWYSSFIEFGFIKLT